MRARSLVALFGACAFVSFIEPAAAHGGMYRGPADTVPPAPGGGGGGRSGGPTGPTTGGPSGPSAPGPSGPTTGGPGGPTTGGPGGGGGGPRGRSTGGVNLEPDLSTWDYWWEFNKDSYLQLKNAVHSGVSTGGDDFYLGTGREASDTQKPTRNQIRNDVLPALVRAISSTDNRDIQSSCLIALAKIGEDHPDAKLVDVFGKRLQRHDQEIRETAALCFGIAGRVDNGAIDVLTGLALDDAAGRAASGGEVNMRTRAFALYGLGLLAWEHTNLAVKRAAFATMRTVLANEQISSRDLKVAAIHGIGLLNVGTTTADDRALQSEALAALVQYYDRDLGAGHKLIQAHCPTAIARLLRNDAAVAEPFKERFAEDLEGKDKSHKDNADIARSCVLALGQLCGPFDDDRSKDARYSKLLLETVRGHRDMQTRWFAMLALGQIGGGSNELKLIDMLKNGKALEKPWCALALGVLSHEVYAAQEASGGNFEQDRDIGNALAAQFADAGEPSLTSALAIALGLNRNKDAAAAMGSRLRSEVHKEEQAGYLCIGLGLMHDRRSIGDINAAMDVASRRPALLERSAIALGLLGDKSAAEKLVSRLGGENSNLATFSAFATALGQIGDSRTIDPLKQMLFDDKRGDLVRAFSAVALGGIADRAPLPWYAKVAANVNYRAAVETLTNQNSGILDLL